MSPIFTSGLPLLRSINAVSLTKSKGFIRHSSGSTPRTGMSISTFPNIVTLTRRKRRSSLAHAVTVSSRHLCMADAGKTERDRRRWR